MNRIVTRITLYLTPGLLAWCSFSSSIATAQIGTNQAGVTFGGIATSQANATDDRRIESQTGGSQPTLHPLTEEIRDVSTSPSLAGASDAPQGSPFAPRGKEATTTDHHVKRRGYVRLHTTQIHPQPDLRNANNAYAPICLNDSQARAEIHQALEKQVSLTVDFQETPLRSVISQLQEEFDIPIMADVQGLADAGIDLDGTTVTKKLRGISLRSVMRLLLQDAGLTYIIDDEVLQITTKEKAQETPVVYIYPLAAWTDAREIVDLIQSTVAPTTWEANGGAGAIRVILSTNCLVISQTQEIHEDTAALLSRLCDGDLEPRLPDSPIEPAAISTRVYPVRDEKTLQELQQKLVALCNAALGAAGDPEAKISVMAGRLVVQSRKRSFHLYAAEMIRAIHGVDVNVPEYLGVDGTSFGVGTNSSINMRAGAGMFGGTGLCWVAREVYGPHDPRWLVFRGWLTQEAPPWLRELYAARGEAVADWLHDRTVAKATLRRLMNVVVEPRLPGAPGGQF